MSVAGATRYSNGWLNVAAHTAADRSIANAIRCISFLQFGEQEQNLSRLYDGEFPHHADHAINRRMVFFQSLTHETDQTAQPVACMNRLQDLDILQQKTGLRCDHTAIRVAASI